MTELEEAELTDGQGRSLSAHRSKAYDGYAKRTAKRALAAKVHNPLRSSGLATSFKRKAPPFGFES
jgi:hypothetical protein